MFHNSNLFGSCIIHILYIYSTNISTEYFKHGIYSPFFPSSKCSLFHNSNVFVSCIIHILYTECAKIKKRNNSGLIILTKTSVSCLAGNERRHLYNNSKTVLACSTFPLRPYVFCGVSVARETEATVALLSGGCENDEQFERLRLYLSAAHTAVAPDTIFLFLHSALIL